MPLLREQADKLSQNDVVVGLIEEIITVNQVFEVIPFVGVNGKAYLYKRENALESNPAANGGQGSGGKFQHPNEIIDEDAASFTEVITKLRILVGDVDVDNFIQETESDTEDQLATQISLKVKLLARKFQDALVNGNTNVINTQFDGMKAICAAADMANQIITPAAAQPLSFDNLDALLDKLPNGADFLQMRSGTRRAYVAACRAVGGNDAVMIQLPNFGKPVLTHNGVPILINDYLPANETLGANNNTTSVYAVRANELDGLHGLYGGKSAGLRVENVGTVQNKDAVRTRVKWYCGLALKSTKSMARLVGVTNV